MKKLCGICRTRVGTILSWRRECYSCHQFVCRKHFAHGYCTECIKKIAAVVVLERHDDAIVNAGETAGTVVSKRTRDLEEALFTLKAAAFLAGAHAVVQARLMNSSEDTIAPKSIDEMKSGRWSGSATSEYHQYRGEAVRRSTGKAGA